MTDSTGFAAFALYNALKLHFTSDSYDFIKYHGKTNVSTQTFMKRKDKYSFYKRRWSIFNRNDYSSDKSFGSNCRNKIIISRKNRSNVYLR